MGLSTTTPPKKENTVCVCAWSRQAAMVAASLHARYAVTPVTRVDSVASRDLADMRPRVGACDPVVWARAVGARDPVTVRRRRRTTGRVVNRATFKFHELVRHTRATAPRRVALLAEAPGGFLCAARDTWPCVDARAATYAAPGAIAWSELVDAACVVHDLPHYGDLLRSEAEDALVDRVGAHQCDLTTADGGGDVPDLDIAEQHGTPLVLAQVATALRLQARGGALVLKVFEGCTLPTRQLFEVLRALYARVLLFKPRSSKACNSERYVLAVGLHDEVEAARVAVVLRRVVETCSSRKMHVHDLGVGVSDVVHRAFDTMAATQVEEIDRVLACCADGNMEPLRALASAEERALR